MFFDSVSNQTSNQNNNVSQSQLFNPGNNTANTISFGGSSGGSDFRNTDKARTDFGRFAPINNNTTTPKVSNDMGASVGVGIGGSGSGGPVAMSRKESDTPKPAPLPVSAPLPTFDNSTRSAFDGYSTDMKSFFDDNKDNLLSIGGILVIGVGIYVFMKRKKKVR